MVTRRSAQRVVPALVLAAFLTPVLAQAPATPQPVAPPKPAVQPPADSIPATAILFDPDAAEAVFERARRAYRELKSYRDTARLRFVLRARDAEGKEYAEDSTEELAFTSSGSRKFLFEQKHFTIHSDGLTQTVREIAEDPSTPSRFVQRPAEEGIVAEARTPDIELICAVHAPANIIISPARFAKEFPVFTQVTAMVPEMLGDKVGVRLSGKGFIPSLEQDQTIPVTAWFASDTGLLHEISLDLKSVYDLGPDITVDRALAQISFTDITTNEAVPDERFVFKPGDTDEKAETLVVPDAMDPQQELVGMPAPEFKAADLDGKDITHADLKDKVAVLAFWSVTWPPSVDLLTDMQELAATYASKGVAVLGVNQDIEDQQSAVRKAVSDRNITVRQLTDMQGELALKFWVESVPCTVVIDAKGVVRWIHTGGAAGFKKQIVAAIDAALSPVADKPAVPPPSGPEKK